MTRIRLYSLLSAALLSLGGCAGLRVSSLGAVDPVTQQPTRTELPGIPIRIKEPVWVQETKILETGWQIQFVVKKAGSKDPGFRIPEGGPMIVSCASGKAVNNAVSAIIQGIDTSAKEDAIREQLRKQLPVVSQLDATNSPDCRKTVGNVLKQDSRLSHKAYYVTNVIPIFGSGSGTFKLASDGTLTEATTSATDDTAKTLLGLFPIKEKLTLRWGIDKKPDPAGFGLVKSLFTVEADLTAQRLLYTLRKDLTPQTAADTATLQRPQLPAPLSLASVDTGVAELVSVENGDAPPSAKPDPKAYKISGAITPPEPEKQTQ